MNSNFLVAVYDSKFYIGKIIEYMMKQIIRLIIVHTGKVLKQFRWANKPDREEVNRGYILRIKFRNLFQMETAMNVHGF